MFASEEFPFVRSTSHFLQLSIGGQYLVAVFVTVTLLLFCRITENCN